MGTTLTGAFKQLTGFRHATTPNAAVSAIVLGNGLEWAGSTIPGVAHIGGSYLAVGNLIQRAFPNSTTHTDGYVMLYKLDQFGAINSFLGFLGAGPGDPTEGPSSQNYQAHFIRFSPDNNWLAVSWYNPALADNNSWNTQGGLCFYQRTPNTDDWTFHLNAGLTATANSATTSYAPSTVGAWSADSTTFAQAYGGSIRVYDVTKNSSFSNPIKTVQPGGTGIFDIAYLGEQLAIGRYDTNFNIVFDLYAANSTTLTVNANNITLPGVDRPHFLPIGTDRLVILNDNSTAPSMLSDFAVGNGTFTANPTGTIQNGVLGSNATISFAYPLTGNMLMVEGSNSKTYLFSDGGDGLDQITSDSIPNPYWIGQSAGNLVFVNQSFATTTTVPTSGYTSPPALGPLMYNWTFDGSNGTTNFAATYASTPLGNATVLGSPSMVTAPTSNSGTKALEFQNGQSIEIAEAGEGFGFLSGDFTIEFWYYSNRAYSGGIVLTDTDTITFRSNESVANTDTNQTEITFVFGYGGDGGSMQVSNNAWTHIAIQKRFNGSETWFTLYSNGQYQDTFLCTVAPLASQFFNRTMVFNGSPDVGFGTNSGNSGYMRALNFWNYAKYGTKTSFTPPNTLT